jgi:hypothetical protein
MANSDIYTYDPTLQAAQIARQQKMAELLQQQAEQPIDIQSYQGTQAPISWGSVLAKALKSGLGTYLGGKADQDAAALQSKSLAEAKAYYDPNHDVNIPGASYDVTLGNAMAGNDMAGAPKPSINPEDLQGPMNAPSVNPEDLQVGPTPDQNPRGLKLPDIFSAPQKYTFDIGPSTGTATYSPDEQMARARAAQFNPNPVIRSAAAGEIARLKPEYVAGSEYGTNRINPDGTITQVIAPTVKAPAAPASVQEAAWWQNATPEQRAALTAVKAAERPVTNITQPTSPDNALLNKMAKVGWSGLTKNEQEVLITSGKHPPPSRDQEAQGQMVLSGMPVNQVVGGFGSAAAKQAAMDSGVDMYIAAHPGASRSDAASAISAAQQDYKAGGKAVSAFRDPNSKVGQNIISGDTAIQHLDVFVQLAKAMKNGDVKLLNQAKNAWQTQFGVPAPNNIALAGQYVSNELERSSLGQAGTGEERKITAALHSGNNSYDTLVDAANTDKAFVSGRLKAVRNSWPGDTGRPLSEFDTTIAGHLNPETRRLMGIGGAAAPGGAGSAKPDPLGLR